MSKRCSPPSRPAQQPTPTLNPTLIGIDVELTRFHGQLEVLDLMGIFHQIGEGGFAAVEALAHSGAGLSTGLACS
jgi:hypothetical protein